MQERIYKIVSADLWQVSEIDGVFNGAGIDLADGFIHLSTAKQVRRTAELYFGGQAGLVLVEVNAQTLGTALVYEPSREGAVFPHLYAPLDLRSVISVFPIPLDAKGHHVFPEFMP